MSIFDWTESTFDTEARKVIEDLLVEFHDIFARHRFGNNVNTNVKVKLTPIDDSPAYSQNLQNPVNLKEDITVEIASYKCRNITTLPFSKYASPIFAQTKRNGKLRIINNLISDDYIENNHPVNTLTDAAQHMARKNLFCNLDCSQVYHCLKMADPKTVEMLAFNFASRTLAYRRLAQNLSRSLSAFSSFLREYLDSVIKADQCARYVDDNCPAANSPEQLITNLRVVFKCILKVVLKLLMAKCHIGLKGIDFFGRTIRPNSVIPQKQKVTKFMVKVSFPSSKKELRRPNGFLNYYRN